jgi:hypothetical protein
VNSLITGSLTLVVKSTFGTHYGIITEKLLSMRINQTDNNGSTIISTNWMDGLLFAIYLIFILFPILFIFILFFLMRLSLFSHQHTAVPVKMGYPVHSDTGYPMTRYPITDTGYRTGWAPVNFVFTEIPHITDYSVPDAAGMGIGDAGIRDAGFLFV